MESRLYREIAEQPEALRHVLVESERPVRDLVAAARRRDVRYIVLAARGTSDNAAAYAKYLLELKCGLPVALAAPSIHTLYDGQLDYRSALVIGVSQSGAGEDITEVVAAARRAGALTVAITNTAGSPLARAAERVLLCHAGIEESVAATKTYTTTLAIFARIAAAWAEDTEFEDHLSRIPEAAARALTGEAAVAELARTLWHAERLLTIARGPHLSTALEAALKIAETTYTPTQAFSAADLLHGPIAAVSSGTPCLLFLPRGRTAAGSAELQEKLAARGARILRGSPDTDAALPLVDPGDEWLSPLVDILPAQLLAYHLCCARGLDPDRPRGLTKVTITR
jgi:glucosamine--fructose-6-phosphate aminotransferase (isomerizing)